MGRRVDVYDYYAYVYWGAGTWTDIYYWGKGYLTVRAWGYQSEVVKIYSPNSPFHYLDARFSAWGVRIEALPWSSKIDIYGLAWTWVRLNADANGGSQNVTVSSPGTNEVWTGSGDDTVTVKTGGRYTFIDTGYGWDTVNLGVGIDTYVYKRDGSLSLNPSPYRSGLTQVRAGNLDELHVRASSYTVDIEASSVNKYARADIYGLGNVRWWTGGGSGEQNLTLSSPGKVEAWTGDGNDNIDVFNGGWYTWLSLAGGWDTVYLTSSSLNTDIQKTWGSINLSSNSIIILGRVSVSSQKFNNVSVKNLVVRQFFLDTGRADGVIDIDVWGDALTHIDLGDSTARTKIRVGSITKNEIWASHGNDNIEIRYSGYTFIDARDGDDFIQLETGWRTDINKGSGSLVVRSSSYHGGDTSIRAGRVQFLDIQNSSWGVFIDVEDIRSEGKIDIYGLSWTKVVFGAKSVGQSITVSSPRSNDITATNGDDRVFIKTGGSHSIVNFRNGYDYLYINDGVNVSLYKGTGSLTIDQNLYLAGKFFISSQTSIINTEKDIRAWQVHLSVTDTQIPNQTKELNPSLSNPYVGITALSWAYYNINTGQNELTVNAYAGYSGTGNISGRSFLRTKSNGYTDLYDYGGKNSYVIGRQRGPINVWAKISLEQEGMTWIAVQGETFILSNIARTGGQFLINNGGIYQDVDFRKGNNGFVQNPFGGIVRKKLYVGENEYSGNYILTSEIERGVSYYLGGRNGQVVDCSNSDKPSFISTQNSNTNNYVFLNQANYDFGLGSGDYFVANAYFTKNAYVTFGKKATLLLNISKPSSSKLDVVIHETKEKIFVTVGNVTVISINKQSETAPETIILNILGFGSFTVKMAGEVQAYVPGLGGVNSIQYVNNPDGLSEVELNSNRFGSDPLLGWGLQNLSATRLNGRHGLSEYQIFGTKILFASQAKEVYGLDHLSKVHSYYLSNNVHGKSFYQTFSVENIKTLSTEAFFYLKSDFYDSNVSDKKLSYVSKLQAREIPALTSLDLILNPTIFNSFRMEVKKQLVLNVLTSTDENNVIDFVNYLPNLPALYFRNLTEIEVKIVKEKSYSILNHSQKEAINQAELQYQQQALFRKYENDFYQASTLAMALYGGHFDVPSIDHWRPTLNLGLKPTYHMGAWCYIWVTVGGLLPGYIYFGYLNYRVDSVLGSNNFKAIEEFMESGSAGITLGMREAWSRLRASKALIASSTENLIDEVLFMQGFRHHSALYRGFSSLIAFGVALEQANEQGNYDGIILLTMKIIHVIGAMFQVPSAYFIDAVTKEAVDGSIEINSLKEFLDFYERRCGIGSLNRWGNKFKGKNLFDTRGNESLIRKIGQDSHLLLSEMNRMDAVPDGESGIVHSFTIEEPRVRKTYARKWLRTAVPVFFFEVTDLGGGFIDFYGLVIDAQAASGVFGNPNATAGEKLAMLFYLFSDIFSVIGDVFIGIGDFSSVIFLLAEQGTIAALSSFASFSIEPLAYGIGAVAYTLVFVALALAYLAQITPDNILMPVLGAIQELSYAILSLVAAAFPPFAIPIFAFFLLMPNLATAVLAAAAGDQNNLILDVAKKIGSDPTMTWDRLSGYVETCQPFKAIYIQAHAIYTHLEFAAAPLGAVLGPLAQVALGNKIKDQIMYEQDFADSAGVMTHALFNYFKTVGGENFIFQFLTQDVKFFPGGSGIIDWRYYEGESGFGKKIDEKIAILKKLYKSGVQFFLSFRDASTLKFPNGNAIAEGEFAFISNIGPYSGAIKLAAPTNMYHDAIKLGESKVIDFSAFYLRMSEIDKNITKNLMTIVSFGLQGKSIDVSSSNKIKVNLLINGDIGNEKNKIQTIRVLSGIFEIQISSEKAGKNMVLIGGTDYNSFHGAKKMYGNEVGTTSFFAAYVTEYVEGGKTHQADIFGIVDGYKLRKLIILEHEVQLFTQDNPSRDTTVQTRNIHSYTITAATQEVIGLTDHQPLSLLFVTRHVSSIWVKSGAHWYVNITQLVPGVFVRFETLLGEITVSSRGNTIVIDDPNKPSSWQSVYIPNSDFSQGTYHWSTDYGRGLGFGKVQVESALPAGWNMGAVKGLNGAGYFLLVDGGPDPTKAFWRVDLGKPVANAAYRFGFWMTANDIHQAKVQLYVNGKPIQSFTMVSSQDGWSQHFYTFIPQADTPLKLELKDLETNPAYNDLIITNMSLGYTTLQGKVSPWTVTPPSLINGALESYDGFSTQYQRGIGTVAGTAELMEKPPEWGLGITGPHTGKYFLMADGKADLDIWKESIDGFVKGDVYQLSFYMATSFNPAVLQLYIDGKVTGEAVTSVPGGGWTKKTIVFKAEKDGKLDLSLRDKNDEAAGNDFALDAFSLVQELNEKVLQTALFGSEKPPKIVEYIQNPDFDNGDSGFSSDYSMVGTTQSPKEGEMQRIHTTTLLASGSTINSVGDKDGEGWFLLASAGKSSVDKKLWEETVSVPDSADYLFTYFAASKGGSTPRPLLTVYVNGQPVTPYQSPSDDGGWSKLSCIIPVAQPGQSLTITIKDSQSEPHAIALDKISFTKMPKPANLQPINLLKNGDFGSGFNEWTTGYVYGDYVTPGHAVVTKTGPEGWGLGAVTGPDGQSFFMVNGTSNTSQVVLSQKVGLVEGRYYKLSYDLMGTDLNPAKIQVSVNGVKVGDSAYVYVSEAWVEKTVIFQASQSGENLIQFFDQETHQTGNNFGLANLSLYSVTGPLVFNIRENNQTDAYDARVDTEFYLRPPIKAPKPTPEQQAELAKLPKSETHSPTENLPWQALASASTNNEFNMQVEDLLNLGQPAEIYLASTDPSSLNKIDLGGVISAAVKNQSAKTPTRYDREDIFVSVTKTDIEHSKAIVGDHAFKTNQYMYEVFVNGKEVLDIYSVAGTKPTLAIYFDQGLIYQNAFWA